MEITKLWLLTKHLKSKVITQTALHIDSLQEPLMDLYWLKPIGAE